MVHCDMFREAFSTLVSPLFAYTGIERIASSLVPSRPLASYLFDYITPVHIHSSIVTHLIHYRSVLLPYPSLSCTNICGYIRHHPGALRYHTAGGLL